MAKKNNQIKSESLVKKFKEQINLIQEKTGVNGYVFVCLMIIALICVYFNLFEKIITNLTGTIYPTFWTIKSIESKDGYTKKWLIYWIIFSSFILLDYFSGIILKFIPFYFILKICFLIWLQWPDSNGCYLVFNFIINRIFDAIEEDIDECVKEVSEVTNNYVFNEKNKKKIMGLAKIVRNFKNMASFTQDETNEKIVKNE